MADYSTWTSKKALHNEVQRLFGTRGSKLSRDDLVRLLRTLLWDFDLADDERAVATEQERQQLSLRIRQLSATVVAPDPRTTADGWTQEEAALPLLNYMLYFVAL